MALFDNPSDSSSNSSAVQAFDKDLIEKVLKDNDCYYSIDSDGDIGGVWEDNIFYFLIQGKKQELLHVHSRWRQALKVEHRAEVLEILNEWHKERFWPKAYVRVTDDGELRVFAEYTTDWEHGVTEDQLYLNMMDAVGSTIQLFKSLEEKFFQTPPTSFSNAPIEI